MFRYIMTLILAFTFIGTVYAAEQFKLSSVEWAKPKRAETILQIPAIRNAVNVLNAKANSQLTIRYPGGESGILWASELKGWLISLGIESTMIRMQPGSANAEVIDLLITIKTL